MKKLLLITSLLLSSLAHAVTLDLQLNITGHEPINKQLTLDDSTELTWKVDTDTILITGTTPDTEMETALIKFEIFLKEQDGTQTLINSPTIVATWGKKAELCVVQNIAAGDEQKLSLEIVATR